MHTDADAFLNAIEAQPADDLPRLVFADWLEENGHPDYATFIRLSCRTARDEVLPPAERSDLRRRRFEAFRAMLQTSAAWVTGLRPNIHEFDGRGMLPPFRQVRTEDFLRDSRHWGPVMRPRQLSLLDATGYEAAVARDPYLVRVETLEVEGRFTEVRYDRQLGEVWEFAPVSADLLHGLADGTAAPRLSVLWVRPVRATAADLAEFAASPLAARLEAMRLEVELTDNTRAELRTDGPGEVRAVIDRFLVEHRFRLPE